MKKNLLTFIFAVGAFACAANAFAQGEVMGFKKAPAADTQEVVVKAQIVPHTLAATDDTYYWSYIGDNTPNSGLVNGVLGHEVYYGISVPAEELAPYVGRQIVGLNCMFGGYPGAPSWSQWQPEELEVRPMLMPFDGFPSDDILASGQKCNPKTAQYADYLFDEPYTITGSGVFGVAGVTIYTAAFCAMAQYKGVTTSGCSWLNSGNGWENMAEQYSGSGYDAALAIKLIIRGEGTVAHDARLRDVTTNPTMVGTEVKINGLLSNNSADPITSYKMEWTQDDGQTGVFEVPSTNIAVGAEKNFVVTTPGFSDTKLHSVTIKLTEFNGEADAVPGNSTATVTVPVVAKNYTRTVVLEEGTGTWCTNCPRGIATIESMKSKYGKQFLPISLHTNDEMEAYYSNYQAYMAAYFTQVPTGFIDRNTDLYTTMDFSTVEKYFKQEAATCIAEISVESATMVGNQITVKTNTEFGYDFDEASYRIAYVVLENGVGPYYQSQSDGSKVKMTYDDVARDILPALNGQRGSVPTSVKGGEKNAYEYTFTAPTSIVDDRNIEVAALLIDGNTGFIINAAKAAVSHDITGVDSVIREGGNVKYYDLNGRRTGAFNGVGISETGRKVIKF